MLDETKPKAWETQRSVDARSHEAWEPDWEDGRFSVFGTCSNARCSQGVVVAGEASYADAHDNTYGWHYEQTYYPKIIIPAPIAIDLPAQVPDTVSRELKRAFSHIWNDLDASANAQRAAIEALLTARKIARYKKNSSGKRVRLNLFERLERLAATHKTAADLLHSIRVLGNAGSHGGASQVTREEVFDAFEIIEHALPQIYDGQAKNIAAKAKKLKAKKS